jgi:hypothetical protein
MGGLRWTRKSTVKISQLLRQTGLCLSPGTVGRLLEEMGYRLRVNRKNLGRSSPQRNEQFDYIGELRDRFERRGLPIISVDTKKRELIGNFKNAGTRWGCSPIEVNDHDFRTEAIGVAIPYGVYDLLANRGCIVVGVSHDTPRFAAHAITRWWSREGQPRYGEVPELLILADGGGSNSCRRWAWKTELQAQLCNAFELRVTVAHYPTGTSKWNPIEHRLFSEISKNWAGEPLSSYEKALKYIRTTRTTTGLRVTAQLDRNEYQTELNPNAEELRSLRLKPHTTLPQWNYTISPNL